MWLQHSEPGVNCVKRGWEGELGTVKTLTYCDMKFGFQGKWEDKNLGRIIWNYQKNHSRHCEEATEFRETVSEVGLDRVGSELERNIWIWDKDVRLTVGLNVSSWRKEESWMSSRSLTWAQTIVEGAQCGRGKLVMFILDKISLRYISRKA